jgi:c(7)-type cytochrome triheme protein
MKRWNADGFAPGVLCIALVLAAPVGSAYGASGKEIYEKTCSLCHATGINNAPKFGNAGDWGPRLAGGTARLYESALKGTAKGMPAKGGNLNLADAEVKAAVDYMVVQVAAAAKKDVAEKPAANKPAAVKKDAAKPVTPPAAPTPAPATAEAEKPSAPVAAVPPPPPAVTPPAAAGSGDVNAFNRLLRPMGQRNLPPPQDGIHDPANDGTLALQPPLSAFDKLPRSNSGNRVNWVAALGEKKIQPRWDKADPKAEPVVMDLNIVREVKGSMPDVVYPHKQHTEWLDCSNCHPAIFIPQKGANQISMAAIMLGQKCGVCHGKVAFPVSECRLCHSKKKDQAATRAAASAPESAGGKQ